MNHAEAPSQGVSTMRLVGNIVLSTLKSAVHVCQTQRPHLLP
ncbi:hypothetical protein L830_1476 [Mycobacteroides abscessus MAB_082312_2258]|nr:hypothetical protein L830_1476 [Mycobacteroides abscessus MAB_082312_2258]